jgi:carboxymethylenebutenolidase
MLEDFIAAYDYLKSHKDCNGQVLWDFVLRLIANMMAVKVPTLSAAVPYYGGQPTAQKKQITTPLLLHYAGLDSSRK